ncbi:MAG: PD-(D/E)XK nuclease family protein [Patescibacteria group bacterium]
MRISYSGLETFSTCPAKYKFQYLDKIKTPKSKEAVFGTLIHECLKLFHGSDRPVPPTEDELLKYFAEKWDSGVYIDEQEEAFAFHQGIQILKNYYLQNQSAIFNVVNLETLFEAPILEDKTFHCVTGRIDRIDKLPDGGFEVIDYKTSKKMPAQENVDNNFQLSVYYLGLVNRWPLIETENRPVKLSLYYLRHGEKLSAAKNIRQIAETKEKILDIINQIQKSDFGPKSNPLCPWCQYQPYCPLYRHKFINQDSPAPDDEKIKDVVSEFFTIKEKQGQDNKRLIELKDLINQYCDKNKIERVFGERGYLTRLPQQRFSYDFKKVREILEPLGRWNEILTINTAKFRKVIQSLPYHLRQEINETKKLEREFKVITVSRRNHSEE